jgi:hypothetical protein
MIQEGHVENKEEGLVPAGEGKTATLVLGLRRSSRLAEEMGRTSFRGSLLRNPLAKERQRMDVHNVLSFFFIFSFSFEVGVEDG